MPWEAQVIKVEEGKRPACQEKGNTAGSGRETVKGGIREMQVSEFYKRVDIASPPPPPSPSVVFFYTGEQEVNIAV
jgi:hypothetical protein